MFMTRGGGGGQMLLFWCTQAVHNSVYFPDLPFPVVSITESCEMLNETCHSSFTDRDVGKETKLSQAKKTQIRIIRWAPKCNVSVGCKKMWDVPQSWIIIDPLLLSYGSAIQNNSGAYLMISVP